MQPQRSAFGTAIKYAIITALAMFIFSIITYATKLYLNQAVSWLNYVIVLAGLIFAVKDRRDKDLNGYITYGQAFSTGFLFCILVGVFAAISTYLMTAFIAPDMVAEMSKMQEQKLVEKGLDDQTVSKAMEMTNKFMTPGVISGFVLFFVVLIGTVLTLIVAAIFKRENNQLQQPQ